MSNTTESVSRHGLPRSSLACLACRNAKSKCDGMIPSVIITTRSEIPHPSFDVHAEVDCSRCARLGIECKWRPCQRTGRPTKKRKLSLESQQWSENNDQNHINSNQDDIILDNMLFSDDSIRMISDLLEDDFILRDQTVSLSNESNQSQSPGNQMVEIQKRIHDISSPKQPSLDHPNHLMPLTHSTITTNNTLHQGISRFFTGVGIAIPLFDSKEEIMKESEYCDALLYAAAALGHALYEGHESLSSTTTRKEAIEKINASIFTHTLDRHASIVSLSALILMIYIAYAMNDTLALQIYIDQARTSALALNLQENDGNDLQKAEFAKKVWWELYVIDCIMDVMTNGKIKRQFDGIRINVEFPGKGKDMQHVWDLRVRSVSLLAGTFTHFVKSKDEEKLWAADKIQANIIAEAQGMLLSAMQARLAGNTDWTLNRKQTILFDCLMMLYAGRIHLHRLFWFEDLTLNLDSCSFKREKINDISQGSQEPLKISTGSITSSVEKIAQSSDAILHLMQMDTDAFFKQSLSLMQSQVDLTKETLPITSSHWPPIGCCQMVASFGLAVHMASKGTEDELRAQQSVSSIGMAEASLGILSKVWPVAEYYRQELHQCRLLISQSISNK